MTITLFIIIVTALISVTCFSNRSNLDKLIFSPYIIKRHKDQWFRFITGGFIHGDFVHLFFNMFVLYSFGNALEQGFFPEIFGSYYRLGYIVFYISAIGMADIYTYIKHQDNPGYRSLGASGAVSAVTFACILFAPKMNLWVMGINMPGYIYGILYLVYSTYASKKNLGNIAHDAHLWGAIYGLVFPLLFNPGLLTNLIKQITR
ncbi:MAG: rhomboid family intramembrane serine protease [Bacteroidota bacterium]